jgi:hypothetical protein
LVLTRLPALQYLSGNAVIDWTVDNEDIVIHSGNYTDTDTWVANSATAAGYVASGAGIKSNKVWKTDANGNPGWGTDRDTVYTHPTDAGNKHIPTGGAAGQFLKYSASGTVQQLGQRLLIRLIQTQLIQLVVVLI